MSFGPYNPSEQCQHCSHEHGYHWANLGEESKCHSPECKCTEFISRMDEILSEIITRSISKAK